MTKEREGEFLILGLAVLEFWFPILSFVAMLYIGALHTYTYSPHHCFDLFHSHHVQTG